jgi:cyclohexyl-isocyanide hydratase
VGCLIFPQMDQIDFTGPFEVLSRMPETTVHVAGKELAPIRDVQGLQLTPDVSITEARTFDVLLVPGGYGQQALMHDEEVLGLIRKQVHTETYCTIRNSLHNALHKTGLLCPISPEYVPCRPM